MTGIYPNFPLPDKPSELIRVALEDLAKVEDDPQFTIDMHQWYSRDYTEDYAGNRATVCFACVAGAVISQRANLPTGAVFVDPSDFSVEVNRKLRAINSLRLGEIYSALSHLDIERPASIREAYEVTAYDYDSGKAFRADLEKLADTLEAAGL